MDYIKEMPEDLLKSFNRVDIWFRRCFDLGNENKLFQTFSEQTFSVQTVSMKLKKKGDLKIWKYGERARYTSSNL